MARRQTRFTIYDAMEARGLFESNPANVDARDPTTGESIYVRQRYPKMFYHPEGEEKITVPAEQIVTPLGAKEVNEQRELIWRLARNEQEETALREAGWHDHPGKAVRERIKGQLIAQGYEGEALELKLEKLAPKVSAQDTIASLEEQLEDLKKKLKEAEMAAIVPLVPKVQTSGLGQTKDPLANLSE